MRVAGLDFGTNTCLGLVADIEAPQLRVLSDEVEIVRLGQGVDVNKSLHPEALLRFDATLARFANTISRLKPERVLACATSAARDSINRDELIAIGRKHGIPIEVISGEKEAELTFRGTLSGESHGPVAIVDVGGGSTELMFGEPGRLESRVSLDVGAVRLTERFGVDVGAITAMREAVLVAIEKSGFSADGRSRRVIGVAGTPTTLAAIDLKLSKFDSERVHGHRFTLNTIEDWIARLAPMSVDQRRTLTGMEPKRADVIVAGLVCLAEGLRALKEDELRVSTRGLRYGVAQWVAER